MNPFLEAIIGLFTFRRDGNYDLSKVKAAHLFDADDSHKDGWVNDALYFHGAEYDRLMHRIRNRDAAGIGRLILQHLDSEAQSFAETLLPQIHERLQPPMTDAEYIAEHGMWREGE